MSIYITEQSGDKITGHYLSKKGGRPVAHTFTNCTLDWVKREASLVIENPTVFTAKPADEELIECLEWAARFAEGSMELDESLQTPVFRAWILRCRKVIELAKGGA